MTILGSPCSPVFSHTSGVSDLSCDHDNSDHWTQPARVHRKEGQFENQSQLLAVCNECTYSAGQACPGIHIPLPTGPTSPPALFLQTHSQDNLLTAKLVGSFKLAAINAGALKGLAPETSNPCTYWTARVISILKCTSSSPCQCFTKSGSKSVQRRRRLRPALLVHQIHLDAHGYHCGYHRQRLFPLVLLRIRRNIRANGDHAFHYDRGLPVSGNHKLAVSPYVTSAMTTLCIIPLITPLVGQHQRWIHPDPCDLERTQLPRHRHFPLRQRLVCEPLATATAARK